MEFEQLKVEVDRLLAVSPPPGKPVVDDTMRPMWILVVVGWTDKNEL